MRVRGEILILNAHARWWQIGAAKSVYYPAPVCSKTFFLTCPPIRSGKIMTVLNKYLMDERSNISNTAQNRIEHIQIVLGLNNFPIYSCDLV